VGAVDVPAVTAKPKRAWFTHDDPGGLWRKYDRALDHGYESVPEARQRLVEVVRTGEMLSLYEPYARYLITRNNPRAS
jgi:hypothetical protein